MEVENIAFRTHAEMIHMRPLCLHHRSSFLPLCYTSTYLLIVAIALLHNLMRSSTFKVAENCTCKFARKKR